MVVQIILLVLGAIMSTVFIASKVTNYSLKTIIFKTIAGVFFVALAVSCFIQNPEGHFLFKLFTTLGLFFGLLGDLLLGFKYITTKTKKLWILLGMFAFAFGHISYVLGLLLDFYTPGSTLFIILPFALPIVFLFIYMFIAKRVGIRFGKSLFAFAIFYIYCLTCMLSTSISMVSLHSFSIPTLVMFFVGAISFAASDSMLTGAYFKEGERPKWYLALYSIFYYVAQFTIAFSIFFIV